MCLRQLAEYGAIHDQIRTTGGGMAALAVDEPARSEELRRWYQLSFPILCDTERKVVRAWNLLNRREKGGIADPAVFLLDPGGRVRFSTREGHASRVRPTDMLELLRAGKEADAGAVQTRWVVPTLGEVLRSAWPALRLTLFPPKG